MQEGRPAGAVGAESAAEVASHLARLHLRLASPGDLLECLPIEVSQG